ncbi:MAG: hypothetical protein ACREK1_01085 [Longimicrobiales bacterium]
MTTSLPFELDRDEVRDHLAARGIRGTVHLDGHDIVIAFVVEGAAAESGTHTVRIPLADVTDISMTGGGVKSPRLLLEVKRQELLSALPWADGCRCVMRFRRADGQRLRELIEEIEVRIAELNERTS